MLPSKELFEGVALKKCVAATYNNTAFKLAPHILYTRHDEMYVDASTGELVHPCWFDDELVESPTDEDLESKELNLTKSLSVVEGLDDIRE